MSDKISASARVTLTIEVWLSQGWGEECQAKQIHEQAARDALEKTRNLIAKNQSGDRIVIIGEPKVVAILTTQPGGAQ
jgi:hypothetical protein